MAGNVFHLSSDQPPCGRCGADDVIVTGKMPVTGVFGQPVVIQLCRHCDASAAAGGPLVRFFQEGGGRDDTRAAEAADLLFAWQKEAMSRHGFDWVPTSGGSPGGLCSADLS